MFCDDHSYRATNSVPLLVRYGLIIFILYITCHHERKRSCPSVCVTLSQNVQTAERIIKLFHLRKHRQTCFFKTSNSGEIQRNNSLLVRQIQTRYDKCAILDQCYAFLNFSLTLTNSRFLSLKF